MKIIFISICAILFVLDATYSLECGKPKAIQPLIFGGSYIQPGQFPWVVPLFYRRNDEFFCNSNLISSRHLLTAAHCIHGKHSNLKSKDEIFAYPGRYDLRTNVIEPSSQRANIQGIVIHSDWDPKSVRYDADIAVLFLQNSVRFSDLIQPVCLPPPNLNAFALNGIVVGWGKSENPGRHEFQPKQVRIRSYENEACFLANYNFAQFGSQRTFCAGERGKTPCRGDSGGGYFFLYGQYTYVIAGLVSASIDADCGESESILFTNVAKFTTWIKSVTQNSNSATFASEYSRIEPTSNIIGAKCRYQLSDTGYGCFVNDLQTPDNEIDLRITGGQHVGRRTIRDVSVMEIKDGKVTHFPDLTQVSRTFPNLQTFSITFTDLKKIERRNMKSLSRLKFFLISDNSIEEIPADTFYDLQNLEFIDICRNKIKQIEPNWLITMPRLKVFKARANEFRYIPAGMFRNNPELEEIALDGNKINQNEVDFSTMRKLRWVAVLKNPCIDLEYCNDPNKPKCIRSLRQFNHLVNGYCGVFKK